MGAEQGIRVFDLTSDEKVRAKCLLIDMPIGQYVRLIQNNLQNLDIQRGKILSKKKRVYTQLIEDLKDNTIMPPISLVVSEQSALSEKLGNIGDPGAIEKVINDNLTTDDLYILDGLQRTYCILNVIDDFQKEGRSDKLQEFYGRRIRAELWFDINVFALLYKILVLNTGQVRMSIRHQLEILNIPLRKKVIEIGNWRGIELTLSTYRDQTSTKRVHQYRFGDIVEALTAFITGDPIIDKTNEVVKELERMRFVEDHSKAEELYTDEELEEFADVLFNLDTSLWRKYQEKMTEQDIDGNEIEVKWTSRNELMNSAPILSGLFASFGKAYRKKRANYLERKGKFFNAFDAAGDDPLQFKTLGEIIEEEKKTSKRFGDTLRRFFFRAFNEYFDGEDNFQEIWKMGTEG